MYLGEGSEAGGCGWVGLGEVGGLGGVSLVGGGEAGGWGGGGVWGAVRERGRVCGCLFCVEYALGGCGSFFVSLCVWLGFLFCLMIRRVSVLGLVI